MDDYSSASDATELRKTVAELDALLGKYGDGELTEILDRLDNNFLYEEDGGYTARDWLEVIRERFKKASASPQAERYSLLIRALLEAIGKRGP